MNEKPSAGTIARTICLVLALINMVLSAMGKPMLPIENSTIEALVTSALTVAASVAAWWKNNSFTKPAIIADENLHLMKNKR